MSDVITQTADGQGGGDLRAGVFRAPAPGPDDSSQTVGLRELAAERGLLVAEELVF